MLIDLNQRRPDLAGTAFDVCIVGGGVAGITLATKLGAGGRRVLLVEAGGRERSAKSQVLYRGRLGDLENLPLHETRIRALGGSSHHWGGWCRPLDAGDFARSDFSPDGTWPIGKADLDPYFRDAAAVLGITETRGADLALAGAEQNLATIRMYFSTPPANLGSNHFDALRQSPNVRLLLNAAYLSMSRDAARISALAIKDPRSPTPLLCRARAFVFAMGAVENVRHLLIHNRTGRGIGNAGGALGRYYMQHMHQELGQFVLFEGRSAPLAAADSALAFMASTEKFLRARGGGAFRIYSTTLACSGILDQFRELTGASCRAATASGTVYITNEQVPNGDSRILLTDEADELGLPRVKLDWRIADGDRTAMREAALEFGRYLVRADIGRLRINPAILSASAPLQGWTALPGAPGAAGHQMGGARMSRTADDGVVDGDCRVWGTDNLYLAGSAVFRTSGHATPTLTIVQLALRLADTIERRLAG